MTSAAIRGATSVHCVIGDLRAWGCPVLGDHGSRSDVTGAQDRAHATRLVRSCAAAPRM